MLCVTGQPNLIVFPGEKDIVEMYFKVKPDSEEFNISKGHILEVELTEKAENGRANTELLKKLENITGEKPGIISGHSSRRKKLVFDQEEDEIREKIAEHFEG